MNKRRFFAMVLTSIMTMSIVAGCSSKTNQEPVKEEPKKEVTLTIWHYLNDREALLKEMVGTYEKETGVKVDLQLYSGDQMGAKVQAAAQAKSLPDAWVFAGGKSQLLKYASAGNVLNLADEGIKDWSSRFNEGIISQVTATEEDGKVEETKGVLPGIYGVPLDVNNMQFLYNKDLFKSAGLDPNSPPKTWNEFIEVGKKLKAANIVPFATGMGSWVQYSLTEQYQYAYMGKQKLIDSRNGKISYKDAGLENVLNMISEMRDAKLFADGAATMDLPAAEQMFVNGKVAMIYDGSWAVGVFNSMNPEFKNYGVFMPPMDERATNDVLIPGGIGSYLVVNKESKNTKEAVAFLKWLTEKDQQVLYSNESFNLPANKDCVDPTKLLPQTAEFAKQMDKIQYAVPGYKGSINELYGKGIQMIIIGKKTPADIVKEMDNSK